MTDLTREDIDKCVELLKANDKYIQPTIYLPQSAKSDDMRGIVDYALGKHVKIEYLEPQELI